MVKNLAFILFCLTTHLYAYQGVITVLEAPLFPTPDENGKVFQYVRKGDLIYIHPAEFARDRYEGMISVKSSVLKKHQEVYAQEYKDNLFPHGDIYLPKADSKFYKTIAKSGADAYVLKEHVFLLYQDMREIDQKVVEKDPTDYRIKEPLPEGYPFIRPNGYRGQVSFALGTPSDNSHPYAEPLRDSGYDYNKEIIAVWSKLVQWDLKKRFFFGGTFYMHHGHTTQLTENIEADETTFRLGIGPYLSYDAWRNEDFTFNLYGSLIFHVYDNVKIQQKISGQDVSDSREFKANHFASRLGMQFFIRHVISTFDFVLGTNLTFSLPYTYTAYTSADYPSYWKDSFDKDWSVQQSYFVGLQSDY